MLMAARLAWSIVVPVSYFKSNFSGAEPPMKGEERFMDQ
jgi:hypothetical protein